MPDNKCKWKSKFPDYGCNEPALPDDLDSYCILHSENEDKDLKDFTSIVENRLKGTKTKEGNEEIDLRGCYFPKKFPNNYFIRRTFDKLVSFREATFAQEADFLGATFSQKADFGGATFSHAADFGGATFSQKADFGWATFSQKTYFSGATFSQKTYFRGATFSQMAYFGGATFSQNAGFYRATFSQMAYFGGATFSQASFSWATFSQEADFSEATFSQEADFSQVKFMGRTIFQYIHIPGEVIFQDVDLSRCSFLHSNIDKVDFRYCEFAKKRHRQNILWDERDCDKRVSPYEAIHQAYLKLKQNFQGMKKAKEWYDNVRQVCVELKQKLKDNKKTRKEYEPVRRLYLELKRNFEDKKDWNTAGDFHFGEMECRRKMKGWFGRHLLSLEAPYLWASGYGERPLRAFLILLGFILIGFPFGYWLSGSSFSTSIWDSVQVATLMRLGNPLESGAIWGKRIVAVLEIIFVPTQTALLALALRRKVKR